VKLRALGTVLLAAASAAAQTVTGTVFSSAGNAPLAGVEVALYRDGRGAPAAETVTDDRGGFRFDGIAAGQYNLAFTKAGFDGPAATDAAMRLFRVEVGASVHIEAVMKAPASVAGRVLDTSGRPVPGARVRISGGAGDYAMVADGEGRFEAASLRPGLYRLQAEPPDSLKPPPPENEQPMAWMPVETRVEAAAGAAIRDLEIRLQAAPIRRVSGTVLDAAGPAAGVTVTLEPLEWFRLDAVRRFTAASGPDGTFEFAAVPDGAWWLAAEADRKGEKLRGSMPAQVSGGDAAGLRLVLEPPFTVGGTIVREAVPGATAANGLEIAVLMQARDLRELRFGRPGENGSFQFDNVYPGAYRVQAPAAKPPFYLASILLGERDVLGTDPVEILSGALPLTIRYRPDGGTVRGTVENCGSGTVLLAPGEPRLRIQELLRTASCDASGRFEMMAVRPGEYLAVVLDRAPKPVDLAPVNLDRLLAAGAVHVTVRSAESTQVDLRRP